MSRVDIMNVLSFKYRDIPEPSNDLGAMVEW